MNQMTILPVNLADGDCLYLRWTGSDETGGGSRDEFGLDNITICEAPLCNIIVSTSTTAESCAGLSDGTIMVTAVPTGCTDALEYSLDGGDFVSDNIFTNLVAGLHSIDVRCSTTTTCIGSTTAIIAEDTACPEFNISDPCSCLDNATILDLDLGIGGDDGQFSELVAITGVDGGPIVNPNLDYSVTIIMGGTDASNVPPTGTQSDGLAIPIGSQLIYNNVTMHYELPFVHVDEVGYSISVQQFVGGVAFGPVFEVSNTCVYPNPLFSPVLPDQICEGDLVITLGGTDQGGLGFDALNFTIDGAAADELDPAALALGEHTVVMTWNGTEGTNDGRGTALAPNEPGCTQTVQKIVEVISGTPIIECPDDVLLDCTASLPDGVTAEADFIAAGGTINASCPISSITFEDVTTSNGCGITIQRTYTVSSGTSSVTCMQTLQTTDTTAPVIVCPPGQSLTCFENVPAPFDNAADFIAAGGLIGDDCTTDLADFTVFAQNSDNNGSNCPGDEKVVTRTYFVQDACGNTTTCMQIFTYQESNQVPVITSILPSCYKICGEMANPMDTDITFTTDCSFGATVNITGPTQIGADNCPGTIYQYAYTVTDDCGRDSDEVTRDFIIENDGPSITCAPFNLILECGDPNNQNYIDAHLAQVTAETSCDLGHTISHFPTTFSMITCGSSTVVTFTVTDDCGRQANCTTTIAIQDNTAPEFTAVPPSICDVTNCSADVNYWYNHWTNYMIDGLAAEDACDTNVNIGMINTPLITDCPNGTAETVVTFTATDNCGNTAYMTGTFIVEATPTNLAMMGIISTEESETVETVTVTLEGNNNTSIYETADNGMYDFENLTEAQNYSVTPYLNEDPLNGVSSFDLVLISQHILQVEQLNSPYKIIAADINRSGSVSTIDLLELRKLILHIDEGFVNNTSWRFVEADFVFPQADNPFASIFPEVVNINGLMVDEQHDFIGIKVGDVNGSVVANVLAEAENRNVVGDLVFNTTDQELKAGETYEIAFQAENFEAIHGYQFSLDFDQTAVDFAGLRTGELTNLSDNNFGLSLLEKGVITTSWTSDHAETLAKNANTFHISFTAKADVLLSEVINVSSRYTRAEAYDGNLDLMDVQLRFEEGDFVTNNFLLYQNTPNPFKQETVIGFELPEASKATLNVYDASGKLLKQVDRHFEKGYNSISLSSDDLTRGLSYYQLVTPKYTATKKMIVQ